MRPRPLSRTLLFAIALGLAGGERTAAQPLDIVHAFRTEPAGPVGRLLEVGPGVFLGAAAQGGAYQRGAIYALHRRADGSWDTVVVHSFSGDEGASPGAGPILARDGNFYGTTSRGGAHGRGTIYRMTPSGQVTRLHSFDESDGDFPEAPLVQAPDGALWGVSKYGGLGNNGTLFTMTLDGTFSLRHRFGSVDGSWPGATLAIGQDGNLYGTTEYAGPSQAGTVFRVTPGGQVATVHAFVVPGPRWLTAGLDGDLYGLEYYGDGPGHGTAFRLTTAGTFTVLHRFDSAADGVWYPFGPLAQAPDGVFYGVTDARLPLSIDAGGLFGMTADGAVQRLADLGGELGASVGGLVVGSDGRLYGTSYFGERPLPPFEPRFGLGTAFSVTPGQPATLLHAFARTAPQGPMGRLVEGVDGNLYGTSCYGGLYNRGTVYRLDRAGSVTTLHSFSNDGWCPASGLTRGPDGALYGAALLGYFEREGALFRVTPDGAFTTLWRTSPGAPRYPLAAPTAGPDGQLYVPVSDIYRDVGAVLRIAADGAVETLTTIDPAVAGIWPAAPLLLGRDGQFYGTTSSGEGGIFRMSLDGALSRVHLFQVPDVDLHLRSGLVQSANGRLFGTTVEGGRHGAGIVYSSTLRGHAAVLHEFDAASGPHPFGELFEIDRGRFTGVTHGLDAPRQGQFGTVYAIGAAGAFSTLHRFSWLDGANPSGSLMRAADGALYGTTERGGPAGGGVVFRLAPPAR